VAMQRGSDELARTSCCRPPPRISRRRAFNGGCSRSAGQLIRHARHFKVRLAESYLTGVLFRQILQRIERRGVTPNVIRAARSSARRAIASGGVPAKDVVSQAVRRRAGTHVAGAEDDRVTDHESAASSASEGAKGLDWPL